MIMDLTQKDQFQVIIMFLDSIYFHGNIEITNDEKINDEVVYNIIYS